MAGDEEKEEGGGSLESEATRPGCLVAICVFASIVATIAYFILWGTYHGSGMEECLGIGFLSLMVAAGLGLYCLSSKMPKKLKIIVAISAGIPVALWGITFLIVAIICD